MPSSLLNDQAVMTALSPWESTALAMPSPIPPALAPVMIHVLFVIFLSSFFLLQFYRIDGSQTAVYQDFDTIDVGRFITSQKYCRIGNVIDMTYPTGRNQC